MVDESRSNVEPASGAPQSAAAGPGQGRQGREWLRPLLVVAVAVVVLTVASMAAVLVVGARPQPSYPGDSPEAALQAYVSAVGGGDYATADGLLSARIRGEGISSGMSHSGSTPFTLSVSIVAVHLHGYRATIDVEMRRSYPGAINSSYAYATSLDMVQENGGWKIDSEQISGF
jgi:hypothetical protein